MHYLVRALDASHQVRDLLLDAASEADAHQQARQQALIPLSVAPARGRHARRAPFGLLLFAQEMLALLDAGLAVVEALDTLVEKEPQAARRAVLERLARDLREGLRLSDALRRQPGVFPPLFTGLVASAEGTSDLPRALARYVHYETRIDAVRHRVISASVYPAILLVVGGAVALFLLGYVVPRFAQVYTGANRPLPWASQLLMAWGRWAGEHTSVLWAAFGLALVALAWIAQRLRREGPWRLLRALPGARRHVDTLAFSRLCLTLGMLLEGGIPVTTALSLCQEGVDTNLRTRVRAVRADVASGQPLSEALARHQLSTPVAQRLLRVGERTGQLGPMLTRTAAFHDEETARWIERFARAFEPALMAAIGLSIGLVVVMLYLPVFELAGSLQ